MSFFKRTGDSDGQEQKWTTGAAAASPSSVASETTVVAPVPVLRPSLGRDTSVTGRLSFTAPTRIDGKLKGEVRASDLLVVGEDGFVDGVVRALKLIVHGEIRGEVKVAERVEIGPTGRVLGTVETQCLIVNDGGYLDGDCRISPPRPNLHALRPANG